MQCEFFIMREGVEIPVESLDEESRLKLLAELDLYAVKAAVMKENLEIMEIKPILKNIL